jgi:hypothetical protein
LFGLVEVDQGCCGASTSLGLKERKRQALCACWTNQSLPSRLFQHGRVSKGLDLLQNITPASISLDYIDAWYGSTCCDGYTYIFSIACRTWCGGKIQRSDLHESHTTIGKPSIRPQYPNASRYCCLHYLLLLSLLLGPFTCCEDRYSNN